MAGKSTLIDWEMIASMPGAWNDPSELPPSSRDWISAEVPGTAASSLRANALWTWDNSRNFDSDDWWWRGTFARPAGDGPWLLHIGGLASLADVWINGQHVLRSDSMFLSHSIVVTELADDLNEIAFVCHALVPLLKTQRKPRARWRTKLVSELNLRWFRTTLLGRMPGWSPRPAPVGPWRAITLEPMPALRVLARHIAVACAGNGGTVEVDLTVEGSFDDTSCDISIGSSFTPLRVNRVGTTARLTGTLALDHVERWWPHTHGTPHLYDLWLRYGDHSLLLRRIGFRDLFADRSNDGFGIVINDVPIFARGACWTPTDAVRASSPTQSMRDTLDHVVDTGMNIVRLTGTMTYETDEFYDACDELGIMVWHDMMFANFDYPNTDEFVALVRAEVDQFIDRMQGRPALVVLCGASETEQQAAMTGVAIGGWANPLFDSLMPSWFADGLPSVPYVPSSPTGGALPFHPNAGVAHYYGVGAYLRDFTDARHANVRFASECLAFSNVPDQETIEELLSPGQIPPTHPRWKERVPRDNSTGWDFEDVRDHYFKLVYGEDPFAVRYSEPTRYLEMSRAVTGIVMARTFAEWRRPGSSCKGGIVLMLRDLWPGAGWGLIDSEGRPKAALRALKPVLAPVATFTTDEGLNGLVVHVVNDTEACAADPVKGTSVPARSYISKSAETIAGTFADSTYAYRFGPRSDTASNGHEQPA